MDLHRNQELLDTQRGLWVVKVTFVALLLIGVVEGAIAFISGSAGLLADAVHGLSDLATTLPLWIAFSLSRKKATPQFPYGYHRAEDVAGIIIVIFIAISAGLVGYESIHKLLEGDEPTHIPLAMAIGAVGFVVNEVIAQYRMKVGRQIGSAALVADGHHARVDGLGSLAVVVGLSAVLLGAQVADPAVGLLITGLIIALLLREAGPLVLSRIMDRIDPTVVSEMEETASGVPGVLGVYEVRARWVGHRMLAELSVCVDDRLTIAQGHQIAEEVQHQLLHSIQNLRWCTIHLEPSKAGEAPAHEVTAHHFDVEQEDTDEAE